jgi:hypothetical protein
MIKRWPLGHRVGPARWAAETDRLLDGMAGRFARVETRRRARGFLLGLLAELPRKNCWVRHEAPRDRVGVRDLHRWAVAAAWVKLGAA